MTQKKRTVGLLGAVSIGVGGMVGGGIFAVLGEAVALAHGATAISFLIAGGVALLTSYSYAKLSVTFQNRGGTVVFIDKAFSHNLFSGSVNFMLWLSYLVTISLYAVAFASYAQTFFQGSATFWSKHILICLAIILPASINLLSAALVSKFETAIVFIKILLLIVIIFTGFSFVDIHRLSPTKWGDPLSITLAGMIIFVAYEGFELIANAAEEIKNPTSNLPKAFWGSTLLVIILYAVISIITVGTVPENELIAAKDYALAVAARPALGQVGFIIVAITALLATFSAINATIFGNARLGYILAKEGELPRILEKERQDIPDIGIVIITLFSLFIANLIDLKEIAIIGSAGFLLIFSIINVSAYKLYREINGNQWIILTACLTSSVALITLLIKSYANNPKGIWVFLTFITISLLFEMIYGKLYRCHFFQRPYKIT